jgi:hypothetical protein
MFLKAHPYSYRMRTSRIDYEQDAVRQAHIAVNSMIRDQVKGEVTAHRMQDLQLRRSLLGTHANRRRSTRNRDRTSTGVVAKANRFQGGLTAKTPLHDRRKSRWLASASLR